MSISSSTASPSLALLFLGKPAICLDAVDKVVAGKGESGEAAHSIKNALTALMLPPTFFRRGVAKRASISMSDCYCIL